MKLSHNFTKTLRQTKEQEGEVAKSTSYLLRAGFIHQELAGVYDFLPLGLRVLNNIEQIIREELDKLGCQEFKMTTLQNPAIWEKTNRWDDNVLDVWFKTDLKNHSTLGLAPTHEEPITNLMRKYITSYKDLPVAAYQFQTKFRNELRAKSGILRTREFLMKDLYSFSTDEATHQAFYAKIEQAYVKIYQRLGIGDITFKTFASGGAFSKFSHEYQTLLPIGEDTVWHNQDYSVVLNDEVMTDQILSELNLNRTDFTASKAAEVGNIFTLGERFSRPLELTYADQSGKKHPVFMGCYGIGVSRLLGVIAERFADEKGLIWPESIAPFRYYLVPIGDRAMEYAKKLHDNYPNLILLDDRDLRPGEKFADAELFGIPYRLVLSDKTIAMNQIEQKTRQTGEEALLTIDQFIAKLM